MNPKTTLVERPRYMKQLRSWEGVNVIKVLSGIRRGGKSTLLQMFASELRLQRGVAENQIQFLNFEDPDIFAIGDWKAIYDAIKTKLLPDKMNYIFLDEVQNVAGFQRLVDGLFIKPNCDVYITGSNADLLTGELATLLTGRYVEIEVLPHSFAEYRRFLSVSTGPRNAPAAAQPKETLVNQQLNHSYSQNSTKPETFGNSVNPLNSTITESFHDFLHFGGLPQVCNSRSVSRSQSDDFAAGILNTIVEKDVYVRNEIRQKAAFNKILDFVMDSIGSFVSANSIAKTLKAEHLDIDAKTVLNHLEHLSEAMLIHSVSRYDVKGKTLLQTLNKYYLTDPSFRRVRLGKKPEQDMGHLLENAVYLELRRRYERVLIGKVRDKEIDFVVTDRDGYTSYYQVAWTTALPETLSRELAP